MKKLLFFFLGLFLLLAAGEPDAAYELLLAATMASDPSAIIEGKVNAITGSPCVGRVDLCIAGKEPISLTRHYVGVENAIWHFGWDFAKAYEMPDSSYRFIVQERGEAPLIYKKDQEISIQGKKWIRYSPSKLNRGVSNTAYGMVSSRTNPLNHTLLLDEKRKYLTIHRADGTVRSYKKVYHGVNEYKLLSEKLPNGNWILYDYLEIEGEKKKIKTLLSQIRTTNPSQTKIYASAKFFYPAPNQLEIIGSDGQKALYQFDLKKGQLTGCSSSQTPDLQFAYSDGKIKELSLPLKRGWQFSYYANGKVKALFIGGKEAYRFSYQLKENDYSVTKVTNGEEEETHYLFSDDQRIWKVKRFSKEKELIQTEEYLWGNEKLQAKMVKDAEDQALFSHVYTYDEIGNLVQERFYGNLTGKGPPLTLNHLMVPQEDAECFTKRYRYSKERPSLLLEAFDDTGKRVLYSYLPETDLPLSQITYEKELLISRKSYRYDADHILIEVIEDDGASYKTISRTLPIPSGAYLGMPEEILDLYGEEKPLQKRRFSYTTGGKVAEEKLYDAEGHLLYETSCTYDEKGRLTQKKGAGGRIENYRYDLCGNPILVEDLSRRVTIRTEFDLCNRKIGEQILSEDGIQLTRSASYDRAGRLIEEIDPRGHSTHYRYNALGLKTKIELPTVLGVPSISHFTYDSAGNLISETDPNGHTTKKSYSSYSKPTAICYPDGAREEFTYTLDGSLKTKVDPLGVTTSFVYDALGRLISKTLSMRDRILSRELFLYQGKCLMEHLNPENHKTTYRYDEAGRKISEECGGEKLLFSYDASGRLFSSQQGDLRTLFFYDPLDQLIEERKEAGGALLEKRFYRYDQAGNQIEKGSFIEEQIVTDQFIYDAIDRLIATRDRDQLERKIVYDDLGCLRRTESDGEGLETIDTFDAQNRLYKREVWKGKLLQLQEKQYDAAGYLIHQIDLRISPGKSNHIVHTRLEYDARGRITKRIEAADTLEAKTTGYRYTPRGELAELIKPDGTKIHYQYNELGHLISFFSSDYSVAHKMSYDRLGRLVTLDGIQREWDAKGRLLREHFPLLGAIIHKYDPLGQKISSLIPSASCLVERSYQGDQLQKVERKTPQGKTLYSHTFSRYDLGGNLLEEGLSGNLGKISYELCGSARLKKISSPYFTQEVTAFDRVGNMLERITQGEKERFGYDALYQLEEEPRFSYSYDSLYNRVQKNGEEYQINDLQQLSSHFHYDPNGNPVAHGELRYRYDALDRLIEIKAPDWSAFYTYDPLHRRLSSTIREGGREKRLYFLYDGMDEIGACNERAEIQELKLTCAIELQEKVYVPIHDLQGSITKLLPLDKDEEIRSCRYSAFGERKDPAIAPWGFCAKREDEKSGLIFFGRRYYLPEQGRFLTPDPAGFVDGVNLYAFVKNSPLTNVDLDGLFTCDWQKGWVPTPWNASYSHHPIPHFFKDPFPIEPYPEALFCPAINPWPTYAPHYYVNGIGNSYKDHLHATSALKRRLQGNPNMISSHSKSFGPIHDLFSVFAAKKAGYDNENIGALRRKLELDLSYMQAMRDPRKITVTCHSRGATDLFHAVKNFSSEQKEKLVIMAFGPTMVLPNTLGFSVTNIISEGDWCSQLASRPHSKTGDPLYKLIFLKPASDNPFSREHAFLSDTYQSAVQSIVKPEYERFSGPIR